MTEATISQPETYESRRKAGRIRLQLHNRIQVRDTGRNLTFDTRPIALTLYSDLGVVAAQIALTPC
jgi:hypothetical protein